MKFNYIAVLLATSLVGCSSIPKGQYEDVYAKERSAKIYPDMVVSEIVSVYDGDTIRVNLTSPKGLPDIISKNISIRFDGIDTPEIRGSSIRLTKIAKEARDFVKERLDSGNIIILKRLQRGKYFRIIAEVEVDGINLNQELIDEGLARPYFGGSKVGIWDNRFKINRKRLQKERQEEADSREHERELRKAHAKRLSYFQLAPHQDHKVVMGLFGEVKLPWWIRYRKTTYKKIEAKKEVRVVNTIVGNGNTSTPEEEE